MINLGTSTMQDFALGDNLVERIDLGDTTIFDPYTTLTGTLPLTFNSRAAVALKNYRIHGTSEGAGVETENLVPEIDNNAFWSPGYINQNGAIISTGNYGDNYRTSDFISVAPNTSYSFQCSLSGLYYGVLSYDAQKTVQGFIVEAQGSTYISSHSFTTNDATAYIRMYVPYVPNDSASSAYYRQAMLVSGTSVPSSYIPYGYKIPILNTSGNLWNGEIEQGGISNSGLLVESAKRVRSCITNLVGGQTYFIKSNQNIRMIYAYYGRWTGTKIGLVLDSSTYKPKPEYTFKLPEGANSIGVALMTYPETNIVPSDVTTAILANSSNYDLFIGSTKLGAEEYLDYGEQKVYKRTENLCPTLANWVDGYINLTGDIASPSPVTLEKSSDFIEVSPNTLYTFGIINGFPFIENNPAWRGIAYYNVNQTFISRTAEYLTENLTDTTPVNAKYVRLTYRTYGQTNSPMLVEGSTAPESYIPYLQPTDPPAPLPAIQTYQGENTLSSTETLGEVTVKGRISEISP